MTPLNFYKYSRIASTKASFTPNATPPTSDLPISTLPSVGQIFEAAGGNRLREKWLGKNDSWMGQQLATYNKEDPPSTRVHPIPI